MVTPADFKSTNMLTLPPGAIVCGHRGPLDQAVPFIRRLTLPTNHEIPAHWHPWIEHVTVISGTLTWALETSWIVRGRTRCPLAALR